MKLPTLALLTLPLMGCNEKVDHYDKMGSTKSNPWPDGWNSEDSDRRHRDQNRFTVIPPIPAYRRRRVENLA